MEFYTVICGDNDLPPAGFEISKNKFDKFGVRHEMLPLADVPSSDARYRKAQDDRDKLRKRLNSGGCCVSVPQNRQFSIEIVHGKLMMFPISDLARAKVLTMGEIAMSGIKRSIKKTERFVTVLILTARTAAERHKYEFVLNELGYAKNSIKSFETNLTARGRDIANSMPQLAGG